MGSHQINTEQENHAWTAFLECAATLEKNDLAVELRTRSRDEEAAFSGDYDYLMDASRFDEIVQLFFNICLKHAVSFQIQQRAAFKHRINLFGPDAKKIIFEFWPHAELTTGTSHKGWAFLTYQRFSEASQAGLKEETLALLFVCHLFFKKKDLSSPQVQWRLQNFADRMGRVVEQGGAHASFAEEIQQLLTGIIQQQFTLSEANAVALELLAKKNVQIEDSGTAKWQHLLTKAQRPFRGWGGKVVPCVGPDGSGKTYFITTVMDMVKAHSLNVRATRFKRLFRKNVIYSYLSKRYRKSRGDMPKNVADERMASTLYWVALPAYAWEVLKSLNTKAVLMDRFFLEFMVRGYRESQGPGIQQMPGYSRLCRLIPEPRRMIVLTADYELISSRKADLSVEAVHDFYSRYISFALNRKVSNVLFLNTHSDGAELAKCCLDSFGIMKQRKH